jgi:hypothetical protein
MEKMHELEAWGLLTKKQFAHFLKLFQKRFGKPKKAKRLAISFWNPKRNKNLDTRIRITNKKAEIVQKFGQWENAKRWSFTELVLPLPDDAKKVYLAYRILDNQIGKAYPYSFIQYENYLFNQLKFEIKLGHQFGKTSRYFFEVELLDKRSSLDLILRDLNLVSLVTPTNVAFWNKWNKEVNLTSEDLDEKEIKNLIQSYF